MPLIAVLIFLKKTGRIGSWDSVLENVKREGKYGTGGERSSTVLHTRGRSAYYCKVTSLQQMNFSSLRRLKSTPVEATPPTITRPNNSTHHHAQNCVTLDGYSGCSNRKPWILWVRQYCILFVKVFQQALCNAVSISRIFHDLPGRHKEHVLVKEIKLPSVCGELLRSRNMAPH